MTLFRKVFQTQARPADTTEAPDEEALREALAATPENSGSHPDPFLLTDEADTDEPDGLVSGAETSISDPAPDVDADEWSEDPAHIHSHDTGPEAAHETGEGGFTLPERTETGDDLVDGILAAAREESGQYLRNISPGQETEPGEPVAEVSAAEVGGPEMRGEEPEIPDLPDPEPAEEVAVAPDAASESPLPGHPATGMPGAASSDNQNTDPAAVDADEELDLSAFARAQMSAMGQAEPAPAPPVTEDVHTEDPVPVPSPATGRSGRRAGRVKTRLLGFNRGSEESDPIDGALEATASRQQEKFPVGWLVVVEGPGVGHSFSIFTGASMIGRGEDQVIRLDFGDNSISRQNHAAIAYDDEQNKFYIGHGGKSNIIRRNARPVLSTEELNHADLIRIGETTLRFVALCGSDFQWDTQVRADDTSI